MEQSLNNDGWSWKLGLEETQISRGIITDQTTRKTSNIVHEEHGRSCYTSYFTDDNNLKMMLKKDLMQNCDLPPPLKLFVGPEKPAMAALKIVSDQEDEYTKVGSVEQEKLGLLKALQLSQTRAREAERKVRQLSEERDHLSNSLLQESLRLFAYEQWLKQLELEVSKQKQEFPHCGYCEGSSEEEDERSESCSLKCCVAFAALCLGIAFGCRYLFRGFTFPLHRGLVLDAFPILRRK